VLILTGLQSSDDYEYVGLYPEVSAQIAGDLERS